MLSAVRYTMLVDAARSQHAIQVQDMAQRLGVSASTIRRDLKCLEEEGLVSRVFGGAVSQQAPGPIPEAPRLLRIEEHADEKRRIGQAAARLVTDDQTILIGGGTTTEAMIPFLAGRDRLTALTNNINVALRLARHSSISVVVLGGYLRRGEMSLLGQLALESLLHVTIDRAFFGAYALGAEGLMGAEMSETETDRALVSSASELIVLADASKFSHRGPARLASAAQITTLITDENAPVDQLSTLRNHGVEVIQC